MLKRALLLLPALALALGLVQVAQAPQAVAAVNLCRGTGTYGDVIASITPAGSSTVRYIKAKSCVEWDTNSFRGRARLTCQLGTSDSSQFCDFRGEIGHMKMDIYSSPTVFSHTASDDFQGSPPGFYGTVLWQGTDNGSNVVCYLIMQNNNGSLKVRLGADNVLRSVPNHFSLRGEVC